MAFAEGLALSSTESALMGIAHEGIGRVSAANEGTWLLKKDEMVLNPVQRENFEYLVDHIKRKKVNQSNGQPNIEVKVVHSPVINMQGGGDNARADVEGALDAANERLKADLMDDFSSGGPIYQTLKSWG